MSRNKDEILITNLSGIDTVFRVVLTYVELVVPRIILEPKVHNAIEAHMEKHPIEMVYNRLEMRSFVIGG